MVLKRLHILVVVTLFISCRLITPSHIPYADQLQDVLDLAIEPSGLVGVSAAVIVPGYDAWTGVSGDSYPGEPVTDDMLFDTGSAGKILLGPLILKLAEQGLISLDDPIKVYLPDFPYADGDITVRQLLNHTSGLYMMVKHPESPFKSNYADIDHSRWWTIDEIFTELGGEPFFQPGDGWCYTQAGYQIATLIVESTTGLPLAEAVQKHLLSPLEINGMLLYFSQPIPERAIIAHPWVDVNQDGRYEDVHDDSRNWIASLSRILFYANPLDFAHWGHALFNGDILSQSSMDELLDFYRMADWCGEPPLITGYGLGVQDFEVSLTRGQTMWGHLGSIPGYRSLLGHLPQYGITFAVMTNTDSDSAMRVVDGILEVLLNNLGELEENASTLDVRPVKQPPEGAEIVDTFQKESLFCEHNPHWTVIAEEDEWLNISLEWVVGTDVAKAENAWKNHSHSITINGAEIPDLDRFTHGVTSYTVRCPDEILDIWAKGLSLYLPPLSPGDYEIKWYSQITGAFDNGWVTYKPGNYMEMTAQVTVK